jgi:hypothetical protein
MAQSTVEVHEETAETGGTVSAAGHYYSYETFGVRFFEHAISPERIREAMSELAGRTIEFGPKAVGPARIVRITASGRIGELTVTRRPSDAVAYRLTIPASLHLTIRLAGQNHRFHVDMRVGLTLTARAAAPLRVIIDVAQPSAGDVEVAVRARGLRSRLLQAAANVDEELRRFAARYLAREIEKPYIKRIREIDIAAHIGKAWPG